MKQAFLRWLDGETELLGALPESTEDHDLGRSELRELTKEERRRVEELPRTQRAIERVRKLFIAWYGLIAVLCCLALMGVFLYMTANISRYGTENPRAAAVSDRYIEKGVEETGAVNAVAGMILDYRAFDTLGESHVLFTALVCVMVLLGLDSKNTRRGMEDYYQVQLERYYPVDHDPILRWVGLLLSPCIMLYGIYILLGGHIGPGGGFSGGAVLGTGFIILASALGDGTADRFLTVRAFKTVTFLALAFYSFAKGYVFFTGANGIENHIPKGTPGAILSAGLILPLDVAVGLVVAFTMFGFYSLFRRGSIGGDSM